MARGRLFFRPRTNARRGSSAMVGSQKKGEGAEEARKRILDAAQTLFAVHGFNATTTRAIAEQAKVPGGLVFSSFPTKEALLNIHMDKFHICNTAIF
jgi:AcrR family transcriptional regulator